jgi:hypothetical protein
MNKAMNLDELSFTKDEKKMKNPKHDTNIIQIVSLKSMTMYVKTTIIPTKQHFLWKYAFGM